MPLYTIYWDCGYGTSEESHDCDSLEDAKKIAEELCREEAESNWTYGAELEEE